MADREHKDIFQDEFLTDVRPKVVVEEESVEELEEINTSKKGKKTKKAKRSKKGTKLALEESASDSGGNLNVNDLDMDSLNKGNEYDDYTQEDVKEGSKNGTKKSVFGFGNRKKAKNVVIETIPENITIEEIDYTNNYADEGISLEDLEAEERVRQRKEFAKAKVTRKKEERKMFIQSFSSPTTLVAFILFTVVSFGYLTWLNNVPIASAVLAIIGGIWMTYWFVYKQGILDIEQQELQDLSNFASQINFHMQNGKNVADTLEYIKGDYSGRVGADIEFTYSKLMSDGELVTSNFDQYNFTAFNVFARNLQIAYHDGIEPKKLFKFPLNNINFEWVERNKLLLKNMAQKKQEFMSVAIAALIPCSLRIAASQVFTEYLGYPLVAVILSLIVYFGMVKVIVGVQKVAMDVSVSL